jgi:hypothetical protein
MVIGENPVRVRTLHGGVHIINNSTLPIGTAVWILWDYEASKPANIVPKDELLHRVEPEVPVEIESLDYLEGVASLPPLSGPDFLGGEEWDLDYSN